MADMSNDPNMECAIYWNLFGDREAKTSPKINFGGFNKLTEESISYNKLHKEQSYKTWVNCWYWELNSLLIHS